jgi:hypothetical protein
MTEGLVETWCASGGEEIEDALHRSPAVQSADEIRAELATKVERLHRVADAVYGWWIQAIG